MIWSSDNQITYGTEGSTMFFLPWMPFFAPRISFPWSGDLVFPYSPYTKWEAPSLYRGDERIEQAVYTSVASPGSQLGNIIDLLDEIAESQGSKTDARQRIGHLKQQVDKFKEIFADTDELAARNILDRLKSKQPEKLNKILQEYSDR